MNAILDQTVRDIANANPAAARVFEQLGIDYCCGGKRSLSAACERASVSPEDVVKALEKCEPAEVSTLPEDAGLGDLAQYIVERHHGFVRRESLRIQGLLAKVCEKHGQAHAELPEIRTMFATLNEELAQHMFKEERILFPYISALDASAAPTACFGSVESPIAVMIADHEDAGSILAKIRALSNEYTAPARACPTFRAMYAALQEFERDLHWHVHLENNILFPRAIAAERELRGTPASAQ